MVVSTPELENLQSLNIHPPQSVHLHSILKQPVLNTLSNNVYDNKLLTKLYYEQH